MQQIKEAATRLIAATDLAKKNYTKERQSVKKGD
jgi:hypothetical protein